MIYITTEAADTHTSWAITLIPYTILSNMSVHITVELCAWPRTISYLCTVSRVNTTWLNLLVTTNYVVPDTLATHKSIIFVKKTIESYFHTAFHNPNCNCSYYRRTSLNNPRLLLSNVIHYVVIFYLFNTLLWFKKLHLMKG